MDEACRVEIAQSISKAKELEPALYDLYQLMASQKWTQYQAYLKVGFSEAQALELIVRAP